MRERETYPLALRSLLLHSDPSTEPVLHLVSESPTSLCIYLKPLSAHLVNLYDKFGGALGELHALVQAGQRGAPRGAVSLNAAARGFENLNRSLRPPRWFSHAGVLHGRGR